MIGIYTKKIDSVWFGVACIEQRVFGTAFANSEQESLRCLLSSIPFNVPFQVFHKSSVFADNVLSSVKNIYDGKDFDQRFSLITAHLSAYTQRVLKATSLIPVGYVASYGSVAKAAGGSPRAVGRVMALNPLAPLIPCHRVVNSNFKLGGYGGGLKLKLELLAREKRGYTSQRIIPIDNRRLPVFPVEFVLRKLKRD
jgi:O-6-methylguanine DNA methyltransferase